MRFQFTDLLMSADSRLRGNDELAGSRNPGAACIPVPLFRGMTFAAPFMYLALQRHSRISGNLPAINEKNHT
jgi:hypothetical protein